MGKLVSVIVPAYNVEKYLERCITSLCEQSYKNLEILLVNDGSSDSTPVLCDEWKNRDSRIAVIHQENGGQCAARNVALNIMHGEYVMFVDSDDYIHHDMISQMVDAVEKNNLDFVRSAYMKVKSDENAELTDREDTGNIICFTQRQIIENFLTAPYSERKCFTAIMWAALYKSQLFATVRFPNGLIYEEGFVLPSIYLASESAGYIDKSFYYYRDNNNGTMAISSMTDRSLKSMDDWKGIHYSFKEKYPEFNTITCERWVKGYLSKLAFLVDSDTVDKDGFYKKKIIDTLTGEREYFARMNIDKRYLKEIDALMLSVEKWKNFRKQADNGTFLSKVVSKLFKR